LILPEVETIVQGVNLGIVLACFLVLYRAARDEEENPVPAKAIVALFLGGMFLVGVGALIALFGGGPRHALLLKHIGFDTGGISLGYSLVILSLVCVFQSWTSGMRPPTGE
jgi:hypothetical protein